MAYPLRSTNKRKRSPSVCKNIEILKVSEISDLCTLYNLYFKPITRVSITVQIPLLHDTSGKLKSFTTWEIIEKLRQLCPGLLAFPTIIKVVSTTLEFVRFVAELEYKADVKRVVTSLESQFIKLSGFPQSLRVRASEAPFDCPRRHDWESFFRDAQNMDETKPGERPDTLVISGLPVRWFINPILSSFSSPHITDNFFKSSNQLLNSNSESQMDAEYFYDLINLPVEDRPRLEIVKNVFEVFGKIRQVDIPMLDPVQTPSYFEQLVDPKSSNTFSSLVSSPNEDLGTKSNESIGGFGKIGPDTIELLNTKMTNQVTRNVNQSQSPLGTTAISALTFTAYIQYMDFTGFSRAMEVLRGQKLVYAPAVNNSQFGNQNRTNNELDSNNKLYYTAEIKIDFDCTKHLSKSAIQSRQIKRSQFLLAAERRRAEAKIIVQADAERKQLLVDSERKATERKEAEALAVETERLAKKAARAESKRQLAIERCKHIKNELIYKKIELEEQRRLVALRKVQGIHLMSYLLAKVQTRHDSMVALRKLARTGKLEKRVIEHSVNPIETKRSELPPSLPVIGRSGLGPKSPQSNHPVPYIAPTQMSRSDDDDDDTVTPTNNNSEFLGMPTTDSTSSKWENPDHCLQRLLHKREEILRNTLIEKRAQMLRAQSVQRKLLSCQKSSDDCA